MACTNCGIDGGDNLCPVCVEEGFELVQFGGREFVIVPDNRCKCGDVLCGLVTERSCDAVLYAMTEGE